MATVTRIALSFALGITLHLVLPIRESAEVCLAVVALFIGAFEAARPTRFSNFTTTLAAGLLGVALPRGSPAPPPKLTADPLRVEARVISFADRPGDPTCRADLLTTKQPNDNDALAPHTVATLHHCAHELGTHFRALMRLHAQTDFQNESPHPALRNDFKTSVAGSIVGGSERVLDHDGIDGAFGLWRERAREAIAATLDEPARGLVVGLVLGDESAVDENDTRAVRSVSLTHVLAVSGTHVVIVVGAFYLAIAATLRRISFLAERYDVTRIAAFCAIPIVLAYAKFAGGAPSAWRAAGMAALIWSLKAAGFRAHASSCAALVSVLYACLDPGVVLRPAFLLSIAATTALLTSGSRNHSNFMAETWFATWRCTVATAPISLWTFGTFPPLGVLANLALVPMSTLFLLPCATIHVALAMVSRVAAELSAPITSLLANTFLGAARAFASIRVGNALPPLSITEGIIFALACGALLIRRNVQEKLVCVIGAALLLTSAEALLRAREHRIGELRVTYLDVGQGDAALVDLPDGKLLLVDAGGSVAHSPDPGERVIAPLLRAKRRSRIEAIIITHPHPDHFGGVAALIDEFQIGEIWDTDQATDEAPTSPAAQLLERARKKGIAIRTPKDFCGSPHHFGGATLDVLAPCPAFDAGYDPNNNSIVFSLAFQKRRFLFMGDAEKDEEALLLEHAKGTSSLRADFLKVGHHGSRTSSTNAFLAAIQPQFAIISAGHPSPYGHPHAETIAALQNAHAEILATPKCGSVTVQTRGDALDIHTFASCREASP